MHQVRIERTLNLRSCFVFQAEDGIRYLSVTGVQTCALPIWRRRRAPRSRRSPQPGRARPPAPVAQRRRARARARSEERREGKSVDLGGRRIIKKKKKENTLVITPTHPVSGPRRSTDHVSRAA